jgi:lysyl endopeptidase
LSTIRRLFTTVVASCAAAVAVAAVPQGAVTSALPTEYRPGAAVAKAALVLATDAPSRRIDLPAPAAAEFAALAAYNAQRDHKGQPLAIGFGRAVSAAARAFRLADLAWAAAPDGSRSARLDVASPGAAALRVALTLPVGAAGLTVRFAPRGEGATVQGEVSGAAIAEDTQRAGQFWSPVLPGDTAAVELHLAAGAAIPDAVLAVPRVSHQMIAGADLLAPYAKSGIGFAGSCNIDLACLAPPNAPAQALAKSVARLSFVGDDGRSYLCTGTLLSDSVQSQTPYLLTASHCIDSASVARTLNTYWFFDAVACKSTASPAYVQLTGGAVLLGRSQDRDWSIVRLREAPPAGATFAAWRADALAKDTAIATIHHPEGDLKKWSFGAVNGAEVLDDGYVLGAFTEVVWSQGVTEAGSSGGPLLTLAAGGAYYEVRGGLYAGYSMCSRPTLPDYYSDLASALPVMRQYLTPDAANPKDLVAATEFYNRTLNHYFLSTNPSEIAKLDSGATVGWVRTGLRFLVYAKQAPGTSPVCRFYRAPAYGDSHFYSASPGECAATAAAHPVDWIYESPAVFYVNVPDAATGACPAGTKPVYRYFNAAATNHRYTAELVVRNETAASPAWTAEGYGPGPYYPVMCAAAE